jgi:hypothetical protein
MSNCVRTKSGEEEINSYTKGQSNYEYNEYTATNFDKEIKIQSMSLWLIGFLTSMVTVKNKRTTDIGYFN